MNDKLAAIRVVRRSVTVAVFAGTRVDFVEVHHLPADGRRADESASGYARKVLGDLDIASVAMETAHNGDLRRTMLTELLMSLFRAEGIPIFEIPLGHLLDAYGTPALSSRFELATVARSIWPMLNTPRFPSTVLDAATVGLYIQTERLFHH